MGWGEVGGACASRARQSPIDLPAKYLEQIPLERRVIFVLHELDGCPIAEVAATFGLPLHTAYSRHKKAKLEFIEAVRGRSADESFEEVPS